MSLNGGVVFGVIEEEGSRRWPAAVSHVTSEGSLKHEFYEISQTNSLQSPETAETSSMTMV